MNTPFLLSDPLVHALGWTLLHSLWQGTVAVLVFLLLRHRLPTARQRYWLGYGALVSIFAAAAVTFAGLYQPGSNDVGASVSPAQTTFLAQYFAENQASVTDFWTTANAWLEARHPLIVGLWLLGLVFFLLRLAGGFFWVQQLRRRATSPLDADWTTRIEALATRLGQTRPVMLLESALVRVPLTLGWLRPLVLLPVGMVNQLSPAEVEAILAHELAHIARRDWLLNLIQAFVEALFYFHPAVWWLSATVRAERENCCDDLAVALTGDRFTYAKALVRVQEMARLAPPAPALALGVAGSAALLRRPRPTLLDRIQRILNQQHKKSQLMEKFIATALLAGLTALWGVRSGEATPLSAAFGEIVTAPLTWFDSSDPAPQSDLARVAPVESDSVPDGRKARQTQKIVQEDDGGRVEMELQDGQITRLNINGEDVPPADFERHQALTEGLMRDVPPVRPQVWMMTPMTPMTPMPPMPGMAPMAPMPPMSPMPPMRAMAPMPPTSRIITEKDDQGNTVIRLERAGDPTEITVKNGEVWIDGRQLQPGESLDLPGEAPAIFWNGEGQGSNQFFQFDPEQLRALEIDAEALAEQQREQIRALTEQQRQMSQDWKRQEREWEKQRRKMGKEERKQMERSRADMRRAQEEMRRAELEHRRTSVQMERARVESARSNNFGSAFKAELLRDGLITDPRNYSVQLSEKELVVNGQKQPEPLRRKYLELYRSKTGQNLGADGNINIVENSN